MNRLILCGLGVIAVAAAVLTFTSVRELAVMCGYGPGVAWLLPICLDVTAAVATGVWLGRDGDAESRRFARRLAWLALGLSIAANGLQHGLAAAGVLQPVWWIVVLVSAVPPLMLGAVVHLAVLATRQQSGDEDRTGGADRTDLAEVEVPGPRTGPDRTDDEPAAGPGGFGSVEVASAAEPVEVPVPRLVPIRTDTSGPDRSGARRAVRRRSGPSDDELLEQLRHEPGPLSRNAVMRRHSIGAGRADRLIELLGWTAPDSAVAGAR